METVIARISISALQHNMQVIRKSIGEQPKIIGVVKADAYGHNAVAIANAMDSYVDGYAVARLEEAIELREAGIKKLVLMLGGFYREIDLSLIEQHNISFTVHSFYQIEQLMRYKANSLLDAWLQVNIGMQRLGFNSDELAKARDMLLNCHSVRHPLNLISHLSCADDEDLIDFHKEQMLKWNQMILLNPEGETSLANSAACLYHPSAITDYVRPGIVQYGISPTAGKTGLDFGLKPVMTLKSKLIGIRKITPKDAVGYGAFGRVTSDTIIGIVPVGYADGYPRNTPNGTPVLINGRYVKTIGHVCMDMMFIDLGIDSKDCIGDEVILWGDGLPVEHIAELVNTIPYELTTRISKRVKREYVK